MLSRKRDVSRYFWLWERSGRGAAAFAVKVLVVVVVFPQLLSGRRGMKDLEGSGVSDGGAFGRLFGIHGRRKVAVTARDKSVIRTARSLPAPRAGCLC